MEKTHFRDKTKNEEKKDRQKIVKGEEKKMLTIFILTSCKQNPVGNSGVKILKKQEEKEWGSGRGGVKKS